jgi:hypothetical protein
MNNARLANSAGIIIQRYGSFASDIICAMSPYDEAMYAYTILMNEAKRRLIAMDTALAGRTGLSERMICEFCFLQLRMLCELIALGCLTAHGDLVTGKLRGTWQADKIIRDLEELHLKFYPYAATDSETAIELNEASFTKEELVKLWRKCGEVLHRGSFETIWSRCRYVDAIEEIRTWKQKIEAQLSCHAIFMADGSTTALFRLRELDEDEWTPSSTGD